MEADIVTDTDGPAVVNEAVFHDIPKVDEAPENNNPNDALEADEKDAMMQVDADGELVTNSMENIVEILDDIEQQVELLLLYIGTRQADSKQAVCDRSKDCAPPPLVFWRSETTC